MDPNIRLQKSCPWTDPKLKHSRKPDIGIGIRASILGSEYYGEYEGHGQSKTAFELHCPGAKFHGKMMKVAKKYDMEPAVFMEASTNGLTTSILYNCYGIDVDTGHIYHCWITDRTIPLDKFCQNQESDKSRCSLATFCCILRAAMHGLYLSDCHFYNFGILLTENATEHLVVIIDAGSRGILRDERWKKSAINNLIMKKFWKWCKQECATNIIIEKMWQQNTIEQCLETATAAWQSWPFLTEARESSCAIYHARLAKNALCRSQARSTSAYKLMELVGQCKAEDQWNERFALVCYRESEKLYSTLFSEQSDILNELYERITRSRDEDVMVFWKRLDEYRERMLQSSEERSVTPQQALDMLASFKYNELWYELTWQQQQSKRYRSVLNKIVHDKAGWTHAAKAVMEYGLPKLDKAKQLDDATEHIDALGEFAQDLAKWLQRFSSSMRALRQTDEYQKNYQTSIEALQKKRSK